MNTKEDIVKNVFTEKYTKQKILEELAEMERDNYNLLVELFKKYHPDYIHFYMGKEELKTITLLTKLGYV